MIRLAPFFTFVSFVISIAGYRLYSNIKTSDSNYLVFNDIQLSDAEAVSVEENDFEAPENSPEDSVDFASPQELLEEEQKEETQAIFVVQRGDTLQSIFKKFGYGNREVYHLTKALGKYFKPRSLRTGHTFSRVDDNTLCFDLSKECQIFLKNKNNKWSAEKKKIQLTKSLEHCEGEIDSSFYQACRHQDLPKDVIQQGVRALKSVIRLNHLRKGNPFEVVYETFKDDKGNIIKTGRLLYLGIINNGKYQRVYSFKPRSSTFSGFFNDKGQSCVKSTFGAPLNRLSVSSKFGWRHHPVLKSVRFHKGVDLRGRTGTKVMAAADGVVVKAGRNGAYGNYIKIRHGNGTYQTAYAHLHRIHVKRGQRIAKGKVIGTVGRTGRATGPHLHYELIHRGKHVNPMKKITGLPTKKLKGSDLKKFNTEKSKIHTYIVSATSGKTRLALKAQNLA